MADRPRAELLADGGAAAASDDLFRSAPLLAAEGTTHTLRVESEDRLTLVPLIVRPVPGSEERDAISPYGYPGASVEGTGEAPDARDVDWSGTGLVSVFVRERLDLPSFASATERSEVQIYDPGRPRRVRERLAGQIRAAARAGWGVETTPGPAAARKARDEFADAYEETMRRTGAADRYLFGAEYYAAALEFPESWLMIARGPRGEAGAAAIAARSDSHLHYFLGGTADASLDDSPFKCVAGAMLDLADERGLPLNLGGGVSAGDGLERFKRGFANATATFRTHEIVCDPAEYERLAGGAAESAFFPAYRAA